jgi:hypothetical protein
LGYTAEDKLLLQQIATHFNKMFLPHPTAVPEAYLFDDKNVFNCKVNAAASQFGFVISNVSGKKYCYSRAAQRLATWPNPRRRLIWYLKGRDKKSLPLPVGVFFV